MPVALHTPSEVKAAVSGSGRADKAQVGAMVDPDPPARRAAEAGRRRRRAGAGHHPHLARRRPGPHRRRPAPRQRQAATPEGAGMIAFVRGEVAAVTLTSAVLEVGGVGLELMCTPGTLATLRTGQPATLPTSMVVREDSLTLFGFLDDDEKPTFELVQTASGVGPKLAQAMLAVLSPDDLRTRRRRRRRQDPDPGPRHRPEGRPADHPRAQGPDRRPDRRAARPSRRRDRRALARPGAPGPGRPRLVGQGRREGRRRRRARGR